MKNLDLFIVNVCCNLCDIPFLLFNTSKVLLDFSCRALISNSVWSFFSLTLSVSQVLDNIRFKSPRQITQPTNNEQMSFRSMINSWYWSLFTWTLFPVVLICCQHLNVFNQRCCTSNSRNITHTVPDFRLISLWFLPLIPFSVFFGTSSGVSGPVEAFRWSLNVEMYVFFWSFWIKSIFTTWSVQTVFVFPFPRFISSTLFCMCMPVFPFLTDPSSHSICLII